MNTARRAEWLLERRGRWAGLGPAEVDVLACRLSPRAEALVVEMREAGLFPDYWTEGEVLLGFLGGLAEARLRTRGRYEVMVQASEGQEVVRLGPRGPLRLADGRAVRR